MNHPVILLNKDIVNLVAEACAPDLKARSILAQTCRAYYQAFKYTDEVLKIVQWLICNANAKEKNVHINTNYVCSLFRIHPFKGLTWRMRGKAPGDHGSFRHRGSITVGLCTVTLTMHGKGWGNSHMDTFLGIKNLSELIVCVAIHTTMCQQPPGPPMPIPEGIVQKHRDNIPWTLTQAAFYKWQELLSLK